MNKIYIKEKDMPNRCNSCSFCYKKDFQDGIEGIAYICLANYSSRKPMTRLPYTLVMDWKHKPCPLRSLEQHDKEIEKRVAKKIVKALSNNPFLDYKGIAEHFGIKEYEQ